ncbi:MAG: bifunctional folylpolyglutamate synthase/dihydrofolate synthase [Ruminococcus sp.]|nr:bifunctional folylpolyglutamate synthase/dihydrofolate synthase [Ruminococcus sp.]
MTFENAMGFINSFTKSGAPVEDLSRFRELMNKLGNPQESLKCIHIAGTNGKGSTARYLSEILCIAGYKVGEFTSPYIIEYTDRIRINGKNIPYDRLAQICEIVMDAVGNEKGYSQFEITNAIAFEYFFEEKCDIVCLEAGVGGLLDSTNIIEKPMVSVITSVAMDHTDVLGETIQEIAAQKAGIIKEDCPVVLSPLCPTPARDVVRRTAAEKNAEFIIPDISNLVIHDTSLWGNKFSYFKKEYFTKMVGRHQIVNALNTIEALEQVKKHGFTIMSEHTKKGLKQAVLPARVEIMNLDPLFMIDGAHNPESMQALADVIKRFPKKPILCVGMLRNKDIARSAQIVAPYVKAIVGASDFHPNAVAGAEIEAIFRKAGCQITDLSKVGKDDIVIFCGSLYLAEKIRKEFQ